MKKFIITILIAGAVVGGVYWYQHRYPTTGVREASDRPAQEQAVVPVVGAELVSYQGQDGKNAFELLQAVTKVEFKKYDFGVFVESINGIKPDTKHFWKFYLNSKESQVGADLAQTKNGDVIEWKLEQISN